MPQSSVIERIFNTSGPRATDADLGNVLVTAPVAELQDSLDTETKSLHFPPDDVCRNSTTNQILSEQKHTAIHGEGEVVMPHTLAPKKRSQALTAATKSTVVRRTSIKPHLFGLRDRCCQ